MKNIIIICLLALTYTSTLAQEPTKQETMDWIASKIEKYLVLETSWKATPSGKESNITNSFNKYSEGVIFINSKNNINGGNSYDHNIKIDLNNVNSVKIEEEYSAIVINGKAVSFFSGEWRPFFVFFSKTYESSEPIITFNSEPNLYERMYKAFQALAKFNNAEKPKEKF